MPLNSPPHTLITTHQLQFNNSYAALERFRQTLSAPTKCSRDGSLHLEARKDAVAGDEEHVERALPRRDGAPVAVVRLGDRRRHRHLRVAHATFHLPVHLRRRRRQRLAETPRFQSAAPKRQENQGKIGKKNRGKIRSELGRTRRMLGTGNPSLWSARPPCELAGAEAIAIRSSSKARWARPRRGGGGQWGSGGGRGAENVEIIKLFRWNMPLGGEGLLCKIPVSTKALNFYKLSQISLHLM